MFPPTCSERYCNISVRKLHLRDLYYKYEEESSVWIAHGQRRFESSGMQPIGNTMETGGVQEKDRKKARGDGEKEIAVSAPSTASSQKKCAALQGHISAVKQASFHMKED